MRENRWKEKVLISLEDAFHDDMSFVCLLLLLSNLFDLHRRIFCSASVGKLIRYSAVKIPNDEM